jgi:hypothetical protein
LSHKRLEIARHLGRWEVMHNGVALCDFDTAEEAARAADAVARTQPPGDDVIVSVDPRLLGPIPVALTSSQP